MNDYTPTTEQLRDEYRFSNKRPDACGKDFGAEIAAQSMGRDERKVRRSW